MALILSLETSTKSCSVALCRGSEVLAFREESSDQYIHSEKLHVFMEETLKEAHVSYNQLEAIAVGMGPGSYTGLRIGISAAKGLCYALQLPLLSVDGIQVLAHEFALKHKPDAKDIIIPMLDARRMEVYCAIHNNLGERVQDIEARVIDSEAFADVDAHHIHLLGDGAEKCKAVLTDSRFKIHDIQYPSARTLNTIAQQHLIAGNFRDVAYFEPFYLKDFVAGKPKKLL